MSFQAGANSGNRNVKQKYLKISHENRHWHNVFNNREKLNHQKYMKTKDCLTNMALLI